MAISTPHQLRDRRLQLRATAREETLIKVAPERQGVNVTDFIIGASREKAQETLADQNALHSQPRTVEAVHGSSGSAPAEKTAPQKAVLGIPCG
jgi:uncharacterized protein (DUF1778 family)